jgi:hypothetical protein
MSAATDQTYPQTRPSTPPLLQPVRVDAAPMPDPRQSRWLWLVKWLLLVPHYIVLAFLWLAFAVLTIVAFISILFTGRYPRAIFAFNVGVLRWTWRVQYYGYGALATDRYPPFTLDDVPDYPARLEIAYPTRLSRGLVLVKWLLAAPHYLVLALLLGFGGRGIGPFGTLNSDRSSFWGLIQILVVVAAVVLLFRGRYPRRLYDLVIGLDRWVLRVAAYVALMTDTYPPFHLDQGGSEPVGAAPLPPAMGSPTSPVHPDLAAEVEGAPYRTDDPAAPPRVDVTALPAVPPDRWGAHDRAPQRLGSDEKRGRPGGWTGGRIATVVIGAVLGLVALGLLAAGGIGLTVDRTARHDGYLSTPTRSLQTSGYALTSEKVDLGPADIGTGWPDVIGTVRVRATSNDPAKPVFIGIARTTDVAAYLDQTAYSTVRADGSGTARDHAGGPLTTTPDQTHIWAASTSGTGRQTLTWRTHGGDWTLVLANANGSAGVAVRSDVAATLPDLGLWSTIALIAGGVALLGGASMVAIPTARSVTANRPRQQPRDDEASP